MGILRLKELLKEKDVTGKELAEKIGISETGMSNIVKGQSLPRQEVLLQIAELLDVDIRELFYPTKETQSDTLYIKKDGEYVVIGKLKRGVIIDNNIILKYRRFLSKLSVLYLSKQKYL